MSRYRGNAEECPTCGVRYGDFRTGLTYREVYIMLMDNSDDPQEWKYKRRATVLGYWFGLKQEMWKMHQWECEQQLLFERAQNEVPF